MARVPVYAVGLVKLADRTDVDLYGLDAEPDRVEVATTPLVPEASRAFARDELEARIRRFRARAERGVPLFRAVGPRLAPVHGRWCPWCLSPVGGRATYCSDRCRMRLSRFLSVRQEPPPDPRSCARCGGAVFGQAGKVYCSKRCKKAASYARSKGA